MKTASEIRETFLSYFEERGHKRVRSSSLVPRNDPTLLFTNAGMNQFKDVFLGLEKREYNRAATSQKCMRVSGKHNDLENVGRTARHHTFFEMLGNFSFGDYFKKGAIEYGWELCTEVYGLNKDQLVATVYREDDEAYDLWRKHIGLPQERVFRLGEADNFWAMGDTGPCGPCSEIHFDLTGHGGGNPETNPERYFEVWNLVFMQYDRDGSGAMTPLPSPSIDTGMGLERLASLLQGVDSNWETDLFKPLIDEACRIIGVRYGEDQDTDVSLRILADHSRACAFLISDGVIPGNEGRGYVMRKIVRRAIRHAKMLGRTEPILYTLTALVAKIMQDAYPELQQGRDYAAKIVRNEEEKFSATLDHGLTRLDEIIDSVEKRKSDTIPGDELFRLYDTYGFPLDLAREVAQDRDLKIDEQGFDSCMEEQRRRARASWKGGEGKKAAPKYQEMAERGLPTEFTGYTDTEDVEGTILSLLRGDEEVEVLKEGDEGHVVLDRSPFYAEAGGQVGDKGRIATDGAQASVLDVQSPVTGLRLHRVQVQHGKLSKGETVRSYVSRELRWDTQRNHTATHLLHAALREVLGPHVKQSGSLVAPQRLRFDFSHYKAVTALELREIEEMVNRKIRENIAVETELLGLDEALKKGAMALFGEKYGEQVRVVDIADFSLELCGGTHVQRTGDIGLFHIVSESSISAGTRRVEALTGEAALNRVLDSESLLEEVSGDLHVRRDEVTEAVERLSRELKEAQKKVEELQLKVAQTQSGDALREAREIKGIKVLARQVEQLDRNALRQLADRLRNQLKSGVVLLGTSENGKAALVAMVSDDLTDRIRAGDLIREVAPLVGGGGGGRPQMAEAGGKDPSGLPKALQRAYDFVSEKA
ncbi:MAG TPA: alanine--tRNA ligase [Acidobacteriota bacterium]|nr:alanine--tRNA ligase [Acidobacteriota bacterium]